MSTTHFPSIKRRLICMVYEAILLFGVFFAADFMFELLTQNYIPSTLHHWRQLYLFLITGIYFTWFWRHGGQTLAMQTWHIKVVSAQLQTPTRIQAWLRYCAAWMWFLPALCINYLFVIREWPGLIVLLAGIIIWACTARLDKQGKFLHDKLVGTQLILLKD